MPYKYKANTCSVNLYNSSVTFILVLYCPANEILMERYIYEKVQEITKYRYSLIALHNYDKVRKLYNNFTFST